MKKLTLLFLLLSGGGLLQSVSGQAIDPDWLQPNFPAIVGLGNSEPGNRICHDFFQTLSEGNIPYPEREDGRWVINNEILLAIGVINPQYSPNNIHVLDFPEGEYQIKVTQEINHNNIIIKGAGANKTTFYWTGTGKDCFKVTGSVESTTFPIFGSDGSTSFQDPTASISVSTGTYMYLKTDIQGDFCNDPMTGQIVRVMYDGSTFCGLSSRLRMPFTQGNSTAAIFNPWQNVGFECFTIDASENDKGDHQNQSANIAIERSTNCWVRGVFSKKAIFQHIRIDQSSKVEVSGCYIFDGHDFGGSGGGRGYGVNLQNSTGECLIVNNIFEKLRHAMLVQYGSNGNALAYNYSTSSQPWGDFAGKGDLAFHGHWPTRNIAEGNIVEEIDFDRAAGLNGPHNVVFRNQVTKKDIKALSGSSGCNETPSVPAGTDSICVVGNVSNNCISLAGNGNLTYDNEQQSWFCNNNHDDDGINQPIGDSYIYNQIPPFWVGGQGSWPAITPDEVNNEMIPALWRFENRSGASRVAATTCQSCTPPPPLFVTYNVTPCHDNFSGGNFPGFIQLYISGGQTPYLPTSWTGALFNQTNTSAQFQNPTLWSAVVTDNAGQSFMVSGYTGPCIDDFYKNESASPSAFSANAFPNPFRDYVRIKLELPEAGEVSVEIFDYAGRQLNTGRVRRSFAAGTQEIELPRDGLSAGIYFCRITYGTEITTLKLIAE